MPLAKNDKGSLVIAITEAIQEGDATIFGLSLPKDWGKNTHELLSDATQGHLKKVLDEGGLGQFLIHELNRSYKRAGDKLPTEDAKLTTLPTFSDPLSVSKNIVSSLSSLPRQYRFLTRGPAELSERVARDDVNIKLSDQLSLISGKVVASDFKLVHENEEIDNFLRSPGSNSPKPSSFEEKSLYFEYRSSGCISRTSDTKISRDFFDAIRSFYGAAMALNIIDDFDWKTENIVPWIAANEISEGESELSYISRADDDIVKATNLTTKVAYDGIIKADAQTLEESLAPISNMLSSKEGAKLSTAAIWIFRANISPREMDKILEATIAIEVLLGDRETSDRIGLSKLMANRCAYSLGKNHKERREIIDFFVEFYKVRSDIVHNGRFKLDVEERDIVKKGLDLAQRILRHELALLI